MIVSELIAELSELPGDMRVLLQIDDEGNGYNQIHGAEMAYAEDQDAYEIFLVDPDEDNCWGEPRDPDDYDKVVIVY